jgi:anti-sigma factor RsiW
MSLREGLPDCLTKTQLTAFLAGQLSNTDREDAESHLSQCHACRRLMVKEYDAEQPVVATVRAPQRLKSKALAIPQNGGLPATSRWAFLWRPQVATAMAAMALVAMALTIFFLVKGANRQIPDNEVLRQEKAAMIAPRLLAPTIGTTVNSRDLEFQWTKAEAAQSYGFSLLNAKGDIIFQSALAAERLVVNTTTLQLEGGKIYFWYVTAKSVDGTTLDSEIGRFRFSEK